MKQFVFVSMVACVTMFSAAARADLINLDFGSGDLMTGAAAVGSAGDTWNKIDSNSTLNLVNSKNSSNGVSVTVANATGFTDSYYWNANHSPFPTDSTVFNMVRDYMYETNDSTAAITFSGLAAGTYDLYVYSVPAIDGQTRQSQFTVSGTTKVIGPNNGATTLTVGTNYQVMQVTVGSDHTLTVNFASAISGVEADLCGIQLQSVPEPTSAAMVFSGIIGLLAYAWRKWRT